MIANSVYVAEITAERSLEQLPDLPLHLAGPPGTIAVQLRTTVRRLAMGAGLARREELIAQVKALPDLPGLITSPVGGTFIMGGTAWLGICAVAIPPPDTGLPLDWTTAALHRWFTAVLSPYAIAPELGRVEGAWCPGFSDISASGKKLAGLGFRMTRDWVVMRGVMPVQAISPEDFAILHAAHALIGVEIKREAATSLAESGNNPAITVADFIDQVRTVVTETV